MLCENCQDKYRTEYNEKIEAMTPGHRNGARGRLLVAAYRLLADGTCQHQAEAVGQEDNNDE